MWTKKREQGNNPSMSSSNNQEYEDKRVKRVTSESTDKITIDEEIGAGAEGSVYRVDGSTAVKILDENLRKKKESKVNAMVDNSPPDPQYSASIAWPDGIITDMSGSFLGYSMPYKNPDEFKPALEYAFAELGSEESNKLKRYKVARNLTAAVKSVHEAGHAVGDFNHYNILVRDDGYVTLIDCDAFQISGDQDTYGGQTYFVRYAPPEGRGQTLRQAQGTDRFCLGVHIFQFLMGGEHPYQAQGDDAANGDWPDVIEGNPFPYMNTKKDVSPVGDNLTKYQKLPSAIKDLFCECFKPSAVTVQYSRPEPDEWLDSLTQQIDKSGGGDWSALYEGAGDAEENETGSTEGDEDDGDDDWENPYDGNNRGSTKDNEDDRQDDGEDDWENPYSDD